MKKTLLFAFIMGMFLSGFSQTTLDTALNFSVKDVEGNTLDLFEILDDGQTVVIDFFSTA